MRAVERGGAQLNWRDRVRGVPLRMFGENIQFRAKNGVAIFIIIQCVTLTRPGV